MNTEHYTEGWTAGLAFAQHNGPPLVSSLDARTSTGDPADFRAGFLDAVRAARRP